MALGSNDSGRMSQRVLADELGQFHINERRDEYKMKKQFGSICRTTLSLAMALGLTGSILAPVKAAAAKPRAIKATPKLAAKAKTTRAESKTTTAESKTVTTEPKTTTAESKTTTADSKTVPAEPKTHTDAFSASSDPIYKGEVQIDASVADIGPKSPGVQINDMVSKVVETHHNYQLSRNRRMFGKLFDMAQWCTTCKGFESSSEAADVILDEKMTLKTKAAVDYAKQKAYDSLHSQVTACMLQIAMGLGTDNLDRRTQLVADGVQNLKALVGEDEAHNTLASLTAWSDKAKAEMKSETHAWDVLEIQRKSTAILKHAVAEDSVVKEVIDKLHKFNRHSNFSRVSAKVINTALSLAALTPTFISPAAQAAQTIYIACTGGPEEAKLLKEVYLDRRLQERVRRLSQEATLALSNYNLAGLTNNVALLSCSESIIQQMAGEGIAIDLLHKNTTAAQEAKEKVKDEVTDKPDKENLSAKLDNKG